MLLAVVECGVLAAVMRRAVEESKEKSKSNPNQMAADHEDRQTETEVAVLPAVGVAAVEVDIVAARVRPVDSVPTGTADPVWVGECHAVWYG